MVNTNNISLIDTFEDVTARSQAILQRMKTLAVQSANGTYDNADKTMFESTQLAKELTRLLTL